MFGSTPAGGRNETVLSALAPGFDRRRDGRRLGSRGSCAPARGPSGGLRYLLMWEPDTLDIAKAFGGTEMTIIGALFEPLKVQPHPETMAPMAGLATSYEVEQDGTRYTSLSSRPPCPARRPSGDTAGAAAAGVHSRIRTRVERCSRPLERWRAHYRARYRLFLAALRSARNGEHVRRTDLWLRVAGAEAIATGTKRHPAQLGVRAVDADSPSRWISPFRRRTCLCCVPQPGHYPCRATASKQRGSGDVRPPGPSLAGW